MDPIVYAESLGLEFNDAGYLRQALTHRSLVNEVGYTGQADNQRLEFLGDAVVDFVVAEWLFRRYPDAQEGELTSLRAEIVRTQGLAALAAEIDLGRVLRLGRGEAAGGGRERAANLCDAFEALVGAIFLDQGLEGARTFLQRFLERHAESIDGRRSAKDAKSQLQEYTQAAQHVTPVYRIVAESGLEHAKTFQAQVEVAGEVWGVGEGRSKQEAEQDAARAALAAHGVGEAE